MTSLLRCAKCSIKVNTESFPLIGYSALLTSTRRFSIGGVNHKLAWLYQATLQNYQAVIGRTLRVMNQLHVIANLPVGESQPGFREKRLTINGEPKLTVQFDHGSRTENYRLERPSSVHSVNQLFSIKYDEANLPLLVLPNEQICLYRPVHVRYDRNGLISSLNWADKPRTASERIVHEGTFKWQYDLRGRLISAIRQFMDIERAEEIAIYKYSYHDNSSMPGKIRDPLSHVYYFSRDSIGGLQHVTTPENIQHDFQLVTALGFTRFLYKPWPQRYFVKFDFNSDDLLIKLQYPSSQRRVTNFYLEKSPRLRKTVVDNKHTEIFYDQYSKLVNTIVTDHRDTNIQIIQKYSYTGTLISQSSTTFDKTLQLGTAKLDDIEQKYTYGSKLELLAIETSIVKSNNQIFLFNQTFDSLLGHVTSIKDFNFQYHVSRSNHTVVVSDQFSKREFFFDSMGRLVENTLKFGELRVFVLSVQGYSKGKLQELLYKIGESEDFFRIQFDKDIRGQVTKVTSSVKDRADTETIQYRMDGRLKSRVLSKAGMTSPEVMNYTYDHRGMLFAVGEVEYAYDLDGFLSIRKNYRFNGNTEFFHINSQGQLYLAESKVTQGSFAKEYKVRYLHDAQGRLIARVDLKNPQQTVQFLYGDVTHPHRVTQTYYSYQQKIITYIYEDRTGLLVAMETKGENFYVVSDYFGSPIVVFDKKGTVINQMEYSFTGLRVVKKQSIEFPFGFYGGIHDDDTDLLFLDGKVYDPYAGQWCSPNYLKLFERLEHIQIFPEKLDAYLFDYIGHRTIDLYDHQVVTRPEFWLKMFNVDIRSLLPSLSAQGEFNAISTDLPVVKSPFYSLQVKSIFTSSFQKRLTEFEDITIVRRSQQLGSFKLAQLPVFNSSSPIFDPNLLLSSNGHNIVDVQVFSDKVPFLTQAFVTSCLNSSIALDASFATHDKDVHYFVKKKKDDSTTDLKNAFGSLRVFSESNMLTLPNNVNVTMTKGADYVEFQVHQGFTVLNLRYGTNVKDETRRVLKEAQTRGERLAWASEAESARLGRSTFYQWTPAQLNQLKTVGHLKGYGSRLRYPDHQLADDPNNIIFEPSS